ncbi:hypothetical protein [Moorena sp. SIO3I6]|uniref:hypothetical protein n=1 Tax=Moorena sp. SIO3I6 TaxID=2607831 RepID=UPI0013FBEDE3|nr:hypothetical protein [Moorena sp. SIO3I6]NEP27645.1 hypothetical protein [Moorena sp. SIO3I6]
MGRVGRVGRVKSEMIKWRGNLQELSAWLLGSLCSRLPTPYSLLPTPCSLFPVPCSFFYITKLVMSSKYSKIIENYRRLGLMIYLQIL